MKTVSCGEIQIHVAYACPKCKWIHWLTPVQYLDNKYFVICECGEKFKPAHPCGIHNDSSQDAGPNKQTKAQKISIEPHGPAIDMLVAQGFNKAEVISVIRSHNISGSLEEVIQKAIIHLS